jgi:hypothetical protein
MQQSALGQGNVYEIIERAKTSISILDPKIADGTKHILLPDMPDAVLDGLLGEIRQRHLLGLPNAYAWPALLAAASVEARADNIDTNIYAGIVGDVHTGKSVSCERALSVMAIKGSNYCLDLMSGSGEGLLSEVTGAGFEPRLLFVDEMGHLLSKMTIEHSSFGFILNRAFYDTGFKVRMARGQEAHFNAKLSILGGVVFDVFEELFGHATVQGFYDRFLFGQCPSDFVYDYRPADFVPLELETSCVHVHPSVWEEKGSWLAANKIINPRLAEIAIRCATICASIDGRQELHARDLGPAKALLEYQTRVRTLLQPNPGRTLEGELAHKFLNYLKRMKPGEWVTKRAMFNAINAYRIGPAVADRTLRSLIFAGEVESVPQGRQTLVRLDTEKELLSPSLAGENLHESERKINDSNVYSDDSNALTSCS